MFKHAKDAITTNDVPVFNPATEGLPITALTSKVPKVFRGIKIQVALFIVTIIVGIFIFNAVDKASMEAQKVEVCQANQWEVKVPRVHIALPSFLIVNGGDSTEPTLRDLLASEHPELSFNALIAANPGKDLSPMGHVSKTYGGVQCLNIPTSTGISQAVLPKVTPKIKPSPYPSASLPQSAGEMAAERAPIKPAKPVTKPKPVVSLVVKNKASDLQLAAAVVAAGFQRQQAITAVSVAIAESGGNPNAVCYNTGHGCSTRPTGLSYDRGYFQFNSSSHPEVSTACAKNLLCSAQAAYRVSRKGFKWGAWATYNHGSHLKFLGRAIAAVNAMMGV
jgi:hypothetical protein